MSRKRIILVLNILCCWLFIAATAFPCTTFVLEGDDRVYFGRNLDWYWEDGLVIVNPRGIQKTAIVMQGHLPVKWVSKYGSVTFNQFGQERPFGGMNEKGLVIENMILFESEYPVADSRPEIDMLQWIQYQLDTCSNVDEVIASDSKIRIAQPIVPSRIHYLVCDAAGDCATIEFLNGKIVCHRGKKLPYRVLTNNTYEQSLAYAKKNPLSSGSSKGVSAPQSLPRFAFAASRTVEFKPRTSEKDVAYVFETLEKVSQGKSTVWQIVYDISNLRILYRTVSNHKQQVLELKSLNFTDIRSAEFVDIQANLSGRKGFKFSVLTESQHRKYLEAFFSKESLKQEMGDLTPLIEPSLLILRGYKDVSQQP